MLVVNNRQVLGFALAVFAALGVRAVSLLLTPALRAMLGINYDRNMARGTDSLFQNPGLFTPLRL